MQEVEQRMEQLPSSLVDRLKKHSHSYGLRGIGQNATPDWA
jgi:hypothetical protein